MATFLSKGYLRKIRTAIIRLPRNLVSNRWYMILGKHLYLYSGARSASWRSALTDASTPTSRKLPRVYAPITIRKPERHAGDNLSTALVIPHLGRFGNALREVVSAVATANFLGIGNICLIGNNLLSADGDIPRPGTHSVSETLKLWVGPKLRPQQAFSALVMWSRFVPPIYETVQDESWEMTRNILKFMPRVADQNTLVIHIRGGDVFGSRDARNYGQPPLSYFQKVIEHCDPTHVHIVFQDDRNPVLNPLVRLCEQEGRSFTTQSGPLLDDVETLLGAQTLVAGRGTFLPAVVGLSDHVKRVYYFEDKFTLQPPRQGFEVFRVFDRQGDYRRDVLSGNWENRPEQRALMLSYPASRLKLEKER